MVELDFLNTGPIPMHCNNEAAIYIANNSMFHERTKRIEVDCHFVCDCVMSEIICTPFTPSSEQLADIFIKDVSSGLLDLVEQAGHNNRYPCSNLRGSVRCYVFWLCSCIGYLDIE